LNDGLKQRILLEKLSDLKADIVMLQETKFHTVEVLENFKQLSKGEIFYSNATDLNTGVAILFLPRCLTLLNIISSEADSNGRWVVVTVEMSGSTLNLMSIYAPASHSQRGTFYSAIGPVIHDRSENIIIGGDFNCVLNPEKDRRSLSIYADTSHRRLQEICDSEHLLDSYRVLNPECCEYTRVTANGQTASRLDRIYVQRELKGLISDTGIYPVPFSDHCLVSTVLDNAEWVTRGPGFWKLNISLLNDFEYHRCIESFWRFKLRNISEFESLIFWWEDVKLGFANISRQYSIQKARKMRKEERRLIRLQTLIFRKVSSGDIHLTEVLEETRLKLSQIEMYRAEGAKVRSRAQFYSEGEKPTKYFCGLEKSRGVEKIIRGLEINGQIVNSNKDLLETVQTFYENLYKSEEIDEELAAELLANIKETLTPPLADICDEYLTLEDLTKSLKTMKNGKSPGGDGLPVEFYVTFWHLIGPKFCEIVKGIFHQGKLPLTMSQAHVRLLFKKGDRSDIRNYRPISLLGVDYKIISRALSLKLGQVLGDVINPAQTCSIPGRSILTNTALIRDLIQLVEKDNIPGAIVALDNEKAFDRLEWKFLLMSLNRFGFGPNFIKWIRILYNGITSRYLVNNFISQPVVLERGVRQGCSLSALLFVICMETLGATIREDINYHGLCIRGLMTPVKLSQYSDDTTIFVGQNSDFNRLHLTLENFQKASGLKINKEKSVGLFLGSWKDRNDQPLGINWSTDIIQILGIHFSRTHHDSINWTNLLSKMSKKIIQWKHRRLTIFGRAIVINNLILSQLWYIAAVVNMPKHVEKEITKMIFDYLWEGKTHLVSQRVCTNNKLDGGFPFQT
jgi:exonuclease III